jgi:hypothetical protein
MAGKKRASGKKSAGKKRASAAAKKAGKKKSESLEKKVDFVQLRKSIAELVEESAELICSKVLEVAKTGQLAPAKYMFEAVGLFPAMEREEAERPEGSLAFTLLRRMGLPTEPIREDEEWPADTASCSKPVAAKMAVGEVEKSLEGEGVVAECESKAGAEESSEEESG